MRSPSPALIVSCVALAVALGGTGYAISSLPGNSVGTKQIRNGAVTGAKVRARTLDATKFKKGTLLQGPRGEQGGRGEQGPRGEQGAPGTPSPIATTEPVAIAATGAYPGTTRTVATFGPVTVRLRCFDRGGGITGIIPEAISAEPGAMVTWPEPSSGATTLVAGVASSPQGYVYGPIAAEAGASNMRIGIALPDGRATAANGIIGWNSLGASCWMFLA